MCENGGEVPPEPDYLEGANHKWESTRSRSVDAQMMVASQVKEAKEQPKTHTVEQMPKPGRGDTDPRK